MGVFGVVGTQNATLLISGYVASPTSAATTCTEEYDGTSWAAGGANITARYVGSNTGTQNAAILVGGNPVSATHSSATEEYDGTTFVSGTSNPSAADFLTAAGTQNAGVVFGGRSAPSSGTTARFCCNQHYDGTSWTAKNSLSIAKYGSCLLYTSPSPRDRQKSRMPSSA